jgi:hypothetical protein
MPYKRYWTSSLKSQRCRANYKWLPRKEQSGNRQRRGASEDGSRRQERRRQEGRRQKIKKLRDQKPEDVKLEGKKL